MTFKIGCKIIAALIEAFWLYREWLHTRAGKSWMLLLFMSSPPVVSFVVAEPMGKVNWKSSGGAIAQRALLSWSSSSFRIPASRLGLLRRQHKTISTKDLVIW